MKGQLVAIFLYGAALVSAQQPNSNAGPDRALTETRKLLQAFGGTWSVSETYDPSDSMPQGRTGTGQEIWRAGPGERSVMEEYRSTNEHGTVSTGLGLGWWEEESGGFRLTWCSNDNPHGCTLLSQVATWDGDTWIVRDTWHQNGQDVEFKEVFSNTTPKSFTQTLYQGPPGKLKRFLTIKATRVK